MTAAKILRTAADTIEARGRLRDSGQERSMRRTVDAFNALTGHDLSEVDGWLFMAVLKMARQQSGNDLDNFVDGAAYMALAGECAHAPSAPLPIAAAALLGEPESCGLYRDIPGRVCESCNDD